MRWESLASSRLSVDQLFGQNLGRERGSRQVLAQPVVKVLADAPLLAFAHFQEIALKPLAFGDFVGECGRTFLDALGEIFLQRFQTPEQNDKQRIENQTHAPVPQWEPENPGTSGRSRDRPRSR